jgi:flap endonuclease-1
VLYISVRVASQKVQEEEESGKKKKGGIQIPEYWPWEEAKKIFVNPDVLPAHDVEVGQNFKPKHTTNSLVTSWSGTYLMLKDWWNSWSLKRGSSSAQHRFNYFRLTRRFSEERVRKGAEKLAKFLNVKQQGRLDGFFAAKPKLNQEMSPQSSTKKRKVRFRKCLLYYLP